MRIWRAEDRSGEEYIKKIFAGTQKIKSMGNLEGRRHLQWKKNVFSGEKRYSLKSKNQKKKDGKYGGQNIDPLQALQAQCAVEKMDKEQVSFIWLFCKRDL